MSAPTPDRKLYVSLSGTERTSWKRVLGAVTAGVFTVGALVGTVVSRLVSRKAKRTATRRAA